MPTGSRPWRVDDRQKLLQILLVPVPPTFEIELESARDLSPSVRGLVFRRKDGEAFAFDAGQWLSLVLPLPSGEIRRAYSIASAPDKTPRFDLAVTRAGQGSIYLHGLAPGASLMAVGPQGFFTRPLEEPAPALFVGTGTGVAPLRSMIRAALAAGSKTPLWLLFGVRTPADVLYGEDFAAWGRGSPSFRFEPTLSRPDQEWTGRSGHVQLHVRALYEELAASTGKAPHVFICGLERMVGAVRTLLRKEMELPRGLVHSERYD